MIWASVLFCVKKIIKLRVKKKKMEERDEEALIQSNKQRSKETDTGDRDKKTNAKKKTQIDRNKDK